MLGPRTMLLVSAALLGPTALQAQTPPTRADAGTIVGEITALGYLGGWGDQADFDGCPQDDPVGAEVLSLVAQNLQTPSLRAELVNFWADEFGTCDYAPLDDWVMEAVTTLADEDVWELSSALSGLYGVLDADAAGHLLSLASDPARPARVRTEIASAALQEISPSARLTSFVALLTTSGLPSEWVALWSANLLEALGSEFVSALVAGASSIEDGALGTAMAILMGEVVAGTYSSTDPSFIDLVETCAGRPGLAQTAVYVQDTVVNGSYQDILRHIEQLAGAGLLDEQHQAGLVATLTQAWNAFRADRPSAIPPFAAFRSDVEGLVSGGQLSAGDAQALIDAADGAITMLTL